MVVLSHPGPNISLLTEELKFWEVKGITIQMTVSHIKAQREDLNFARQLVLAIIPCHRKDKGLDFFFLCIFFLYHEPTTLPTHPFPVRRLLVTSQVTKDTHWGEICHSAFKPTQGLLVWRWLHPPSSPAGGGARGERQ